MTDPGAYYSIQQHLQYSIINIWGREFNKSEKEKSVYVNFVA
jgi:hypothetical protein